MKSLLFVIIWGAVLIFPEAIFAQTPQAQQQNPDYPQLTKEKARPLTLTDTQTVENIVDGLRLVMDNGEIYHLASLDIPGLFQTEPGPVALAAKDLLSTLFVDKKVDIYQTPDQEEGRMNRMGHHIAHIVRSKDNTWAQATLLDAGLARVRTTLANRDLAATMLEIEETARDNNIGLWSQDNYNVLNTETVYDVDGGFQIVEGTVNKVAVVNNQVYLNFGDRWQEDFTVAFPVATRRLFSKEGLNVMDFRNKTIRTRGWVEQYNGPYIELDHPERIEFIGGDIQTDTQPTTQTEETPQNALPDFNRD